MWNPILTSQEARRWDGAPVAARRPKVNAGASATRGVGAQPVPTPHLTKGPLAEESARNALRPGGDSRHTEDPSLRSG